jgi:plasmid stabilization system protein ParE
LQVRVRSKVKAEVARERDYYEEDLERGSDFVDDFEDVLHRLSYLPHRFPATGLGSSELPIHRCLFRRYPFIAYFVVHDDYVEVLAVLHKRSGPSKIAKAVR